MILNTLYSFAGTLGFGILFNIRGQKLFWGSFGGALSWLCYLITVKYSGSQIFSFFLASVVAGIYSEIMARILKSPVTAFIICGIISLVPGGGMYYTMLEIVQGNIPKSLSTGLTTLSTAVAIALGVLVASSIFKLFMYMLKNILFQKHI